MESDAAFVLAGSDRGGAYFAYVTLRVGLADQAKDALLYALGHFLTNIYTHPNFGKNFIKKSTNSKKFQKKCTFTDRYSISIFRYN